MTTETVNAIGYDYALQAVLPSMGPRQNATAGTPVESKLVLYADRTTEIGIWEVTPGSFPASKVDVCELMQFIAGSATIIDDSGTTRIGPGVVVFQPDGWKGTWVVEETVRKTYALHRTKSRPTTAPGSSPRGCRHVSAARRGAAPTGGNSRQPCSGEFSPRPFASPAASGRGALSEAPAVPTPD